jgi:hypothetical protein
VVIEAEPTDDSVGCLGLDDTIDVLLLYLPSLLVVHVTMDLGLRRVTSRFDGLLLALSWFGLVLTTILGIGVVVKWYHY